MAKPGWCCMGGGLAWIFLAVTRLLFGIVVQAEEHSKIPLPSYHYGANITISCLNRSMYVTCRAKEWFFANLKLCRDTGEHISNEKNELQYSPFPVCNETGLPLHLRYGVEEELNCTIPMVSDSFFHLLEFYVHNDVPLSCRIPSRPPAHISPGQTLETSTVYQQDYVPLIFALAGTLQLSHLHVSTHLNILIHSTPKHHLHHHDSGVIDSGAAYSTSAFSRTTGPAALTKKLVIGDPLPLMLSVRWFPTPYLPRENGKVEWAGMRGHFRATTFFYCIASALAGAVGSAACFFGIVLPSRLKRKVALGGATPLGYGIGKVWNSGKRD